MSFALDPRLERDTLPVADWALCCVRLMNDARFPWLVLVPRRAGLVEWHDLDAAERLQLAGELARASEGLQGLTGAHKMNVGALGNIVSQLHVHVVARSPGDAAWPRPVWGSGEAVPYEPAASNALVASLHATL